MLLTGRAFETLQVVNLVPNTHGHLKRSDPLLAGRTEAVLTKKPEEDISMSTERTKMLQKKRPLPLLPLKMIFFQQFSLCLLQIQDEILTSWISHQPEVVSPTQLSSQLVVKPAAHLPEPAAAQVAAQAVLVPVLLNGLQEEPVADALLAAATREQRRRHLQDLVHRLPAQQSG